MSTSSSSSHPERRSTTDGPAATATAVQPEPPARAGLLLVTTLFVVSALNYSFGLALAWLLPPAAYGLVGVLQALLLFTAMVLNSGFPWTLARSMSRSVLGAGPLAAAPVYRSSLVGNTLLAGGLIGVIAVGHRLGFLDVGGAAAIAIAAITIPLFGLNAVGRAALHGSLRFGRLALVKSGEVAVKVLVGLGLVALGWGIDAVAIGFLAGAVVALVGLVWFVRGIGPGWGPVASLATYRETAPIFAGTVGVALLLSADLLALKGLVPTGIAAAAVVLGFYQAASMLARLPYFLGDSLMDAVYPHIARRHRSPVHSHAYFSAAVRWITLALVPVELVLILAPEPILDLLLPAAYIDAAPLVRILAFGSIAALGTGLLGKALQAVDAAGPAAKGTLFGVGVELPLLAVLVPPLGATGAAIAFTCGSWAAAVSLAVADERRQGQLLPATPRLIRYGVAVGATAPLLLAASGRAWPQGIPLILAALAAYAVVIRLLDLVQAGEIRRLLEQAFRLALPVRRSS